ncbi:MAG: TonB-dependent receptor [Treponema sp.]|nr:TonB-dependent receptor [Treponema sp.]
MLNKKSLINLILGTTIFTTSLYAQESDIEDSSENEEDIIVVSAGKIEQAVSDTVEKVEVVTEKQIQESGAKTVTDALKSIPGVVITSLSSGNMTPTISMQGFDGDYVKVLIDGVAVSGDIGGAVAAFQLPVENIDHIEVVQGASSALYGSDAMGGVVNIITKKTKNEYDGIKVHGSVTEEFGESKEGSIQNYTAGTLSVAGAKLSSTLTGSLNYEPGLKKEWANLALGSGEYYKTPKTLLGYGKANIDWTDDWGTIGIYGLFMTASQLSNYTPSGYSKYASMEYDTKRIESGIKSSYIFDNTLSFNIFSSFKDFILNDYYESVTSSTSKTETEDNSTNIEWESEIQANWKPNELNTVLVGINSTFETMEGDSFEGLKKQLLLSAYAQDTLNIADNVFSVVPGVRLDLAPAMDDSDTLFQATPKLSMRFSPNENTVIRASYGMGYKIPTFKQKYWVFYHNYGSGDANFILTGNPDLKPEKSQGVNLGIEENVLNIFRITTSGYFNYITDMIDSQLTDSTSTPQKRTYVNINKAITYGGDINLSTKLDRFEARAGYAYMNAKEDDDGEWTEIALKIHHRITANMAYKIPIIETKISINGEWSAPQLLSTSSDEKSPDYLMVSLNAEKSFLEDKLSTYIRIDNLLDNFHFIEGTGTSKTQEEYYSLYDGITLSLGATLKF